MAGEIRLDDVGTVFEVTLMDAGVAVNVSTATEKKIIFKKPDGTRVEKTAVFTTNGSDGKIQYTSIVGDLNKTNGWKIQARVTLPTGKWSSDVGDFVVHANL